MSSKLLLSAGVKMGFPVNAEDPLHNGSSNFTVGLQVNL